MPERAGPPGEPRTRGGRGPKPLSKTIRLPLALAVILACGALLVSRFLPGSTVAWEVWLDRNSELVIPVAFSLLAAAVVCVLAGRYTSKENGRWYLARHYLREIRWVRRLPVRLAILGAVDSAADVNAVDLKLKAAWPLSIAKIILLTGALGMVLRVMSYFDRLTAMNGMRGGRPQELEMFIWSLRPIAFALGAAVLIVALAAVLKRFTTRRTAEARAVARALLEHAAERGAERASGSAPKAR